MIRQLTVQEKKVKDLRASGLSLREVAEKLKIDRKKVEEAIEAKGELVIQPTSEKKATEQTPTKGT